MNSHQQCETNAVVSHESVYFYTFHKCASSLFSDYVLKNMQGLTHVDYAAAICSGDSDVNIAFEEEGFIYGPIRLSANHESPVYEKFVAPASTKDFIRNKTVIFMVRDPRDILVSSYYSFGYTHAFSPVKEIAEMQMNVRNRIQCDGIDAYVLANAKDTLNDYEVLQELYLNSQRSVMIRYEDMILNWSVFERGLTTFVDFDADVLAQIYQQSRPRKKEDQSLHQRSGKVGGFKAALKEDTLASLNHIFEAVLHRFEYKNES